MRRREYRFSALLEPTLSLVSISRFEERAGYSKREGAMNTTLYLTVAAIVAILYALAFLLIPVQASLFFSDFAEPRAILYLRFCGAAILAWGVGADRLVRTELRR